MSFSKIFASQSASSRETSALARSSTQANGLVPCGESLLTAKEVALMLAMSDYKKVYELGIARVTLSPGRVRWMRSDVQAFVARKRRAA